VNPKTEGKVNMSETTLEEHQARVDRAQTALGDDLRALARAGRAGTGKMILLLSGAVLLAVVVVRAASRKPKLVVRTHMGRPSPSLMGTLLRMAVLEGARMALTRLAPRLAGALDPIHGALGPAVPQSRTPALMPDQSAHRKTRRDG